LVCQEENQFYRLKLSFKPKNKLNNTLNFPRYPQVENQLNTIGQRP